MKHGLGISETHETIYKDPQVQRNGFWSPSEWIMGTPIIPYHPLSVYMLYNVL